MVREVYMYIWRGWNATRAICLTHLTRKFSNSCQKIKAMSGSKLLLMWAGGSCQTLRVSSRCGEKDGLIDYSKEWPFHSLLCGKGLILSPKWVQTMPVYAPRVVAASDPRKAVSTVGL